MTAGKPRHQLQELTKEKFDDIGAQLRHSQLDDIEAWFKHSPCKPVKHLA
jgi:hypothetical protein